MISDAQMIFIIVLVLAGFSSGALFGYALKETVMSKRMLSLWKRIERLEDSKEYWVKRWFTSISEGVDTLEDKP